jgi:hypothetical protein
MAEEAEAVPLPGPRKTLGRLSGRHWNTPGEGDLDWISIANPSAAGDVRYKKVLEDRSHQLEKDAPTRELNPAIKALRLKKMEGLHRHKRSKRGRGKKKKKVEAPLPEKPVPRWNVEIVHTKESFLKREYEGDLFGTRGNYTSGFVYMSRNANGSKAVIHQANDFQQLYCDKLASVENQISEIEQRIEDDRRYNKETYAKLKHTRIELKEKLKSLQKVAEEKVVEEEVAGPLRLSKSATDALAALHKMSKNPEVHGPIIRDGGYETIVKLMKRLKPSESERMMLCGEFFCNLAHNMDVSELLLSHRIVEHLVYAGTRLEGDKVFLYRVSRSIVNLSMASQGVELVVWQRGLHFLSDSASSDVVVLSALYKSLFNIVCRSKQRLFPWFRECAAISTKMFQGLVHVPLELQNILLQILAHLATFPSLSTAMIGLGLTGRIQIHLEDIIENEKRYNFHGERVSVVEKLAFVMYKMSCSLDSASKMADEGVLALIRLVIEFTQNYSERAVQLALGVLGNLSRSPHGRHKIIPLGATSTLRSISLNCVEAFNKATSEAHKESLQERLKICINGLLHICSDEAFLFESARQGALRVLIAVSTTTNDDSLLFDSLRTLCDILSSEHLLGIYEVVQADVEDGIALMFDKLETVLAYKKAILGYVATALRHVTMVPMLRDFLSERNFPVAMQCLKLALRSFPEESIVILFAGALYNSTLNSDLAAPLCSIKSVQLVIEVMKFAKLPRTDELCLATLQNISHAFHSAGAIYNDGGALEELIELSDSDDDNTRGLAVSILCSLSSDEQNASALINVGILEALLKVAKTSANLASRVAGAFNNFCVLSKGKYMKRVIAVGAIPVMVDMMSSEHELTRRRAAQCVSHIACFDDSDKLLFRLYGVKSMYHPACTPDCAKIKDTGSPIDVSVGNHPATAAGYPHVPPPDSWKHVVNAKGVEQLILTALLRTSTEQPKVRLLSCIGFYTLIANAGVDHPLNKNIAWGAGKMYDINNMCRDMANKILINLSATAKGRNTLNDGDALRPAAECILRVETAHTEEPTIAILKDICKVFFNVFTAKEGRIEPLPEVLPALLKMVDDNVEELDRDVRYKLMTMLSIFGCSPQTTSLFVSSKGFVTLNKLFSLCKKDRVKPSADEKRRIYREGAIAAFACSLNVSSKEFAAANGALDRLLTYPPKTYDLCTKKMVAVALHYYAQVNNDEVLQYFTKRGGIKIPRDLLEEPDVETHVLTARQQIFSRTAFLFSLKSVSMRGAMLEKGISRILLACSTSKNPDVANEVATALCLFSQIRRGLVHLVQAQGVKMVDQILRIGARNYFHAKTQNTYLKCAIALSNMCTHTNSQARLVRDKVFTVFKQLCGAGNATVVDVCSKAAVTISTNPTACKDTLETRDVMSTFTDWFENCRNGSGQHYRTAEKRLAYAVKQFSKAENMITKKFEKDGMYAIRLIKSGYEEKTLDNLSKDIVPEENDYFTALTENPIEDYENIELPQVFHKHNKVPKVPTINGSASSIKWTKEHKFTTELEATNSMGLHQEPLPVSKWSVALRKIEQEQQENDITKKMAPSLVKVENSLTIALTNNLKKQFFYDNDQVFYNKMTALLEKKRLHKIALKRQNDTIAGAKLLSKIVSQSVLRKGLANELARIEEEKACAEREAELARIAALPIEPIKSPTKRPPVVRFRKLPDLLNRTVPSSVFGAQRGVSLVTSINARLESHALAREKNVDDDTVDQSPFTNSWQADRNQEVDDYLSLASVTSGMSVVLDNSMEIPGLGVAQDLRDAEEVQLMQRVYEQESKDGFTIEKYERKYSRKTQRQHIVEGYAAQNRLTPGSKKRVQEYFGVSDKRSAVPSADSSKHVPAEIEEERDGSIVEEKFVEISPFPREYGQVSRQSTAPSSTSLPRGVGFKSKEISNYQKQYSRNTQRKHILLDYGRENKLTPGTKQRLEEHFQIPTYSPGNSVEDPFDSTAEDYETYSFGSYSRKYY